LTPCAFLLKVTELQGRQWTDKEGQKLVTDLTEVIESKTMKLRSVNDRHIHTYEVAKLC
jgi:predicted site-specific integrase-resolvase